MRWTSNMGCLIKASKSLFSGGHESFILISRNFYKKKRGKDNEEKFVVTVINFWTDFYDGCLW